MTRQRVLTALIGAVSCVIGATGCAKETPPAHPAASTKEPAKKHIDNSPADEQSESTILPAMPTHFTCEYESDCLPPASFTKATCQGRFPGLAISMFEKSTPWKRLYFKSGRLEPVNPHGGKVSGPLVSSEEVILLRRHGSDADGLSVSSSDADMLRWDGTCITLPEELFSDEPLGQRANAPITWRYLDQTTSDALLKEEKVQLQHSRLEEDCRKSSVSRPNARCEKSSLKLSTLIVGLVRNGAKLPEPAQLPEWNVQE